MPTTEIIKLIDQGQQLQLEKYQDREKLQREAIAFTGNARTHNTNPDKIYLRLDPLSQQSSLLEFNIKDILFAEEVQTITKQDGSTLPLVRLWIKKKSIGIKLEPFFVDNTMTVFKEI